MRQPARRRWRVVLRRLLFELAVVFVGVYAAFALSAWQARREAAERRRQVERALVREIRDITTNTRRAAAWSGQMAEFYEAGGRLQPKYGWYMLGLRNLHGLAERIRAMGDSLVSELGDGKVVRVGAGDAAPRR